MLELYGLFNIQVQKLAMRDHSGDFQNDIFLTHFNSDLEEKGYDLDSLAGGAFSLEELKGDDQKYIITREPIKSPVTMAC